MRPDTRPSSRPKVPTLRPRLLSRPGLHTTGFYVALFLAMGAHQPFWPLWLSDWGLSAEEIGFYTALGIGVRVVAGFVIPAVADRLDARRWTLTICCAGGAVLFLWHLGITTRPVLLLATLGTGAAFAGITPVSEALGLAAARVWNFHYAQARGIGSSGYLIGSVLSGMLAAWAGSWVVLWWIVVCMLAAAALAVAHPGGGQVRSASPPRLDEIGRLMLNPTFLLFAGAVAFLQASHAVLYALSSIHWRELGVGATDIGLLWAVSVATEVLFLVVFGTAVTERLGAVGTLALGCLVGVVRWGAMMLDPVGVWLLPLQMLHAVTFGTGLLGAMAFIGRAVPDRYTAAAQGASASMAAGAVMALGMAVAAWLYPALGGATYGIGVVCAAIGLALCLALGRRWSGDELSL